ncbi:hypothetical protein E4N99_07205 [Treponema denticola]|uniref:InlB B-repeat-containing protein n=1 Tax=Treponema denticola TaxID=158 RepID=UPI0002B59EAC|nr:hypothetical protein [Treponema denticola]EMB42646.1 hypothetical protein HMPREF9722_00442 [Treponema denticola ATCC 33520]
MNRRLFNFFVISALCAVIFSACGHKPNLDGGGTPLITPKPVKVTWTVTGDGAENPKASVLKSTNSGWFRLSLGDEVYTGTELFMFAENDDNEKPYFIDRDKTKINGKNVAELGKAIAYFRNDGWIKYTIPQDTKAVHIEFVLEKAEKRQIEWKSKNPAEGKVKRWKEKDPSNNPIYDSESSGDFFEGQSLRFDAFPKTGKVIKNWYINGKAQNNTGTRFWYNVQKADFVDGKILIEAEFGDKKTGIKVYASSTDESKGSVSNNISIKPNYESDDWEDHTQGYPCEEGNVIQFEAIPKPGYMVDKWFIKDQELQAGDIFFHYKVVEKDVVSGTQIDIKVSFKEAPKIKVEWSVDEPDKGSIRAEQFINNKWTEVLSGNLFDQSSGIRVIVEPKEGFAPDTWYISGNKANNWTKEKPEFRYTVDINDIVNGSIKISHNFKNAEKINMEFLKEGNGKISVHNSKTGELITDTQIYEGTQLRIKASPFLGSKFKQFEFNGEITEDIWEWGGENSGIYVTNYTVKGKDKDKDTGKITIKAIFETDPDASQGTIPVEFAVESGHEGNGIIIAKFKEKEFASGYKFKERDDVVFYALPKAGYQAKWFVNGNEHRTGNRIWLRVDNPFIGGDGKVSVKAQFVPANPVKINFSTEGQGSVKVEKLMGDEWLTIKSGDTVYEGTSVLIQPDTSADNIADWFINGADSNNKMNGGGNLYLNNIIGYAQSGVCNIKAKFRSALNYSVSFKIAEGGEGKGSLSIEYWDITKKELITSQNQNITVREGSRGLNFIVSLNNGAQVEKWTINGEDKNYTSEDFWFGVLHKSRLRGKDKLEVVVHLK